MSTQREKAEELRRLHAAPEPLVLVNAWDAASARVVAARRRRAIATASWSIAAAHGFPGRRGDLARGDAGRGRAGRARGRSAGDRRPRARLRRRERHRGRARSRPARWAATSRTRPAPAGCGRPRSTPRSCGGRAAGEIADVPMVINARTDVFLQARRGGARRGRRARPRLPGGGRGRHLRAGRERRADAGGARAGMRGPISVFGDARRPDAGRVRADRRRARELRTGADGRRDGRARRAAETLLAGGEPPADLAFCP